jgi:probable F420-dependent oxidoreductase
MRIGVSTFPTDYAISAVELGRELEARGFDSLWVVEHTHIPASRRTPYPPGGDLPSIYWEAYEPFTYLAQVAAVTTTLEVGTGICLVPEHHPITLAKRVASLDSLSRGRFLFGIGAGWNAEELEHHGVRFEDRWKITRESVLAMKAMWTQKAASYDGRFVQFEPVWVEPKPVRKPHPPVYIGAMSRWTFDRIAEYGDGWLPIAVPNLREQIAELARACEKRGRSIDEIDVAVIASPDSAAALDALVESGAGRVIVSLPTVGRDESLRALDGYAALLDWARER